jgi:hypothetical protein
MTIVVAKLVQEKPDFVGAAPGRANEPQPSPHFNLAVRHRFEESALKLAAIHRSIPVNLASATTAQGRARLREFGGTGGPRDTDGQADSFQPGSVVTGLQLDILKERAVAAKPTGKAKAFEIGRVG